MGTDPKAIPVTVEVCLRSESSEQHSKVKEAFRRLLESQSIPYRDGPLEVAGAVGNQAFQSFLDTHVESIEVANTDHTVQEESLLPPERVSLEILVFQLSEEEPGEELEGEEEIATYKEWELPGRPTHGLWNTLVYDSEVKRRLLRYAASALHFSDKKVDTRLISWNRVVLLHGPPGTGKTTLCKALAHKLSVKFINRYPHSYLVEVNAHSLFSKWFSESGKLVTKLFAKIQELVEEEDSLVFVLVDEVESLTAARKAAAAGVEPSDAIRVVNALLTQLDALKSRPNVMVLATTNITGAIDAAFVDRADIKVYIGPPSPGARYDILKSCIDELKRTEVILPEPGVVIPALEQAKGSWMKPDKGRGKDGPSTTDATSMSAACGQALQNVCTVCEGFSGRMLRKLPFLAHTWLPSDSCGTLEFLKALHAAAAQEKADRNNLEPEAFQPMTQ